MFSGLPSLKKVSRDAEEWRELEERLRDSFFAGDKNVKGTVVRDQLNSDKRFVFCCCIHFDQLFSYIFCIEKFSNLKKTRMQ
jgi:hypothetical protein